MTLTGLIKMIRTNTIVGYLVSPFWDEVNMDQQRWMAEVIPILPLTKSRPISPRVPLKHSCTKAIDNGRTLSCKAIALQFCLGETMRTKWSSQQNGGNNVGIKLAGIWEKWTAYLQEWWLVIFKLMLTVYIRFLSFQKDMSPIMQRNE